MCPAAPVGDRRARDRLARPPARSPRHFFRLLKGSNASLLDGEATTTLFNVGATQEIGKHLVLLGSLGRELDTPAHGTLFYFGVQFLTGD